MTKADMIKAKIARAQFHLEEADRLQQEAFGTEAELACYDLHNGIEALIEEMDEALMEVCIPLESV
jgi:hypothetical protein